MTTFLDTYTEIQDICFDTSAQTLVTIKKKINRYISVFSEKFRFDEQKIQNKLNITSTTLGDSGSVIITGYIDKLGLTSFKSERISITAESSVASSYVWTRVNSITQSSDSNGEISVKTSDDIFTIGILPAGASVVIKNIRPYLVQPELVADDAVVYLPEIALEVLVNRIAADILMKKGDSRQNDFWARDKANFKELSILYPHVTSIGISEDTYSL